MVVLCVDVMVVDELSMVVGGSGVFVIFVIVVVDFSDVSYVVPSPSVVNCAKVDVASKIREGCC